MKLRLRTLDVNPLALAELGERLRLGKPASRARLREYLELAASIELGDLVTAAERRVQPELPLAEDAPV